MIEDSFGPFLRTMRQGDRVTRTEELLQACSDAMLKAREHNARGDSYSAIEALITAQLTLVGLIEELGKGQP